MASPNLSALVTTTARNRPKRLIDQVTKNNGLMHALKKKKKVKMLSGGRTIVRELEYQENATSGWFDGYEELNIAPSDVITAAEFDWKQASVSASISGKEKRQNGGKEQLINLYKSRIKNAEKTLVNLISTSLYGDGTASSGKAIGGLDLLCGDTSPATGVVGGIDAATWSFWRHIVQDTSGATSANIQGFMNDVWMQIVRKSVGDKPDLIVADNNYYKHYWESLTANQRFIDGDKADASFKSLAYQGADVIFDGGIDGAATTNRMYFLCTDYLDLCIHKDANFSQVGGDRRPLNQDAELAVLLFMGNMTISNRMVQGLVYE